jgi:hypothetical protein
VELGNDVWYEMCINFSWIANQLGVLRGLDFWALKPEMAFRYSFWLECQAYYTSSTQRRSMYRISSVNDFP